MIKSQSSFLGGMDLISIDTQIADNGYQWLINARQRFGFIEPVTQPVKLVTPNGKKQGIISVGNVTVLFVSGRAYFKLVNSNTWIQIGNFLMDTTVDQYYSIAVPASSKDYVRKLNPSGDITDKLLLTTDFKPAGSPATIVVQDTINQPWLITFNEVSQSFNARPTKTYAQWLNTQTGQEYVPIGKNMMILNQKLFIVSVDGRKIYQSVSGQLLNFMVNIDQNGDKLATEDVGGAISTSFAFDYDPITIISPVNIPDSFLYGTKNTIRIITLDYTNTIFGEPIYRQSAVINAGTLNQYSAQSTLGDYTFIDYEGVKSFDAVQQFKFSGRNSPFSLLISKLLKGIKQSDAVCIPFNNYAIYDLDTIWGRVFAVYDTLLAKWVGVDMFNIGVVKQSTLVDIQDETHLYVITEDDSVYQLYSSTSITATASLFTIAYSAPVVDINYQGQEQGYKIATEIKSQKLELLFKAGSSDGTVSVTEMADEIPLLPAATKPIVAFDGTKNSGLPVMLQDLTSVSKNTFNFRDGKRGTKLAYYITWNTNAKLYNILLVTTDYNIQVGANQQSTQL